MLVAHSRKRRPARTDAAVAGILGGVSADILRHYVEFILPNGLKAQVVAYSRLATIRYHTVLQAAEYLLGHVGPVGTQGDEDQYWRKYAVVSLIMDPYESATNPMSAAYFTSASTAIHYTRAVIPGRHLI